VIKVRGVTLNLIFGNQGILKDLIDGDKLQGRGKKTIQALLLNPYSMNAITRSIQESRPFVKVSNPVKAICEHTLDKHKSYVLYEDFEQTMSNVEDLIDNYKSHGIEIKCRVYNALSPDFLLIGRQRAIMENLILSRPKDEQRKKLYGILPHLVYGNGPIKDSLDSHFDYIWECDTVPLEDFHESVEEKYYEINRLFLLYRLQKEIWEEQWKRKDPSGRSPNSPYDILYQRYKELFPDFAPERILDLGCGDGGGGSLDMLREHPRARIDFVDISEIAIKLLEENMEREGLEKTHVGFHPSDMLTFLNRCQPRQYSLVYANFSIIYMTKIKAIEIYRKIFGALRGGGIFMLSLWTTKYFDMPIGQHGEEGKRPPHKFVRIPMTEDLRVINEGPPARIGEVRRFYNDLDELMDEFRIADQDGAMDFANMHCEKYENGAILRIWVRKRG
jgi:SAM-dependent methyltransferase